MLIIEANKSRIESVVDASIALESVTSHAYNLIATRIKAIELENIAANRTQKA
jgi:hypothetical protein